MMLEDVKTQANTSELPLFALSRSGTLVYVPMARNWEHTTLYWVTRDGSRTEIRVNVDTSAAPRFSPDGEMLVIVGTDDTRMHLYVYDTFRGVLEKVTREGTNITPVWHPDGNRLTYCAADAGGSLMELSLDGGEPRKVHEPEFSEWPTSYSPDGRYLALTRRLTSTRSEIWVRSDEGEMQCVVDARGRSACGRFDPTGGYIAYVSDEAGRWEIYLKPFRQAGRRVQVSVDGGSDPVWSPDGSELFYRNGNDLMAVSVEREGRFRVGQPRKLFEFPFGSTVSMFASSFDIHPDGQRFVVAERVSDTRGTNQVVVVTNWFEELKRALPWDDQQ